MPKTYLALVLACLVSTPAAAVTITDPVGDFALPSYTGPQTGDLDVIDFSVNYDPVTSNFLIGATMNAPILQFPGGFYAIGVNTGTGPLNFASIGHQNVKFNQVIAVLENGTASISNVALAANAVTIDGAHFDLVVPLSRLPSTGFAPIDYGFNIWPRAGAPGQGGTEVISDFAPDNATLSASVPEPATWGLTMLGLGMIAATMRRRRSYRFALAG